jgi:ferredoxin-NADP reductase/ferredoxin
VLGRTDFVHGQFGENLTVEGLADAEVCIGDRYRIGGAVFEVTQPRVTCFKIGLRMGNPQMAALLVRHKRPGFYLRVIQEGDIGAGDAIEVVHRDPAKVSVANVDTWLYTPAHPVADLKRALQVSALSEGWRWSLRALLEAAERGEQTGNPGLAPVAAPAAWVGFRRLRVVATQRESLEVRSFTLASSDGSPLPAALPGQYLAVRLHPKDAPGPLIRSYSLCGSPQEGTYRIAVKLESHGQGSGYLHREVETGAELEVSAPRGSFILAQEGPEPVVLISAGIGITPILAMLRAVSRRAAPPPLWWIHCAKDGAHFSFRGESQDLLRALPGCHSRIIFSAPRPQDRSGTDFDVQGHLDPELIRQMALPVGGTFYLCGPTRFLEDMSAALQAYGVPAARIRSEIFGAVPTSRSEPGRVPHPPSRPPNAAPAAGPRVVFTRSGLSVPWEDRFASLLELAEACDVPVQWSCRTGVCHYCETPMIEGDVRYAPDPVDPPAPGRILICCSVPRTETQLEL